MVHVTIRAVTFFDNCGRGCIHLDRWLTYVSVWQAHRIYFVVSFENLNTRNRQNIRSRFNLISLIPTVSTVFTNTLLFLNNLCLPIMFLIDLIRFIIFFNVHACIRLDIATIIVYKNSAFWVLLRSSECSYFRMATVLANDAILGRNCLFVRIQHH